LHHGKSSSDKKAVTAPDNCNKDSAYRSFKRIGNAAYHAYEAGEQSRRGMMFAILALPPQTVDLEFIVV
jgi:hypothetical protein